MTRAGARTRPWFGAWSDGVHLSAVGLTLCLGLTACSFGPKPSPDTPKTNTSPSAMATPSTELPKTPAGEQLAWLLEATRALPIDEKTVTEHFDDVFLDQAPPDQLNQFLSSLTPAGGLELTSIESTTSSDLVAMVEGSQGPMRLSLATRTDGKIVGLLFTPSTDPAATPTSWDEIDQRLNAVAPQTAMVTAEVAAGGACKAVHVLRADRAQPLGSMFKLYVLGAVARQVRAGELSWDQQLTITEQVKSLPSGVLQDEPADTLVSVTDAATKMISISDNTAADLLALTVGRSAVESAQRSLGSAHADLNVPFLRTKELFVLKAADYPTYSDAYLRLSPAARSTYLADTVDSVPRSAVEAWQKPREIDSLEWFASPSDLCRAFSTLGLLASEPALDPIATIMSADDGGLDLAKDSWPQVWFKGGSEPGVLTVGWRATTAEGRTFVSVLMTADPKKPVDESAAAPELLALARGAFALAVD